MSQFIELSNVLGETNATEKTVQLFNSTLTIKNDEKGRYVDKAFKPHKNGVMVKKEYL